MSLNLPLASLIVLVYFNVVWQIMLWSYNLLHPVLGFMLIIVFPVFAGIAIYIVIESRVPDYIKYVQRGGSVFEGRVAEVDGAPRLYYTLQNAQIKPDEFGASYDNVKPRQSTTTYYKYFAAPVFDADTGALSNIFVCDSIKSGLHIDNGSGGKYGLSETGLPRVFGSGLIRGRTITHSNCRQAAANYYRKTGAGMTAEPVILEVHDESAAEYYRLARIHFWAFTGLFNALFITLFAFVYRANKSV